MNPASGKRELVIVPSTATRDAILAVLGGLVVLAFVFYGVIHMAQPVTGNKLTGTVVEKIFTPQKEERISFSGRHLEGTKEIAGEYVLKVRVEAEKRTYEVPVAQSVYDAKKAGDTFTFLRPPSEQH